MNTQLKVHLLMSWPVDSDTKHLLIVLLKLQDSTAEYFNILSLLEPGGSQKPGPVANSNEDINALKDRLSSFIICARFLEYWVPVEISNLQLEQYCYSILSNSSGLRSFVKSDPVGSLRDILISLRKVRIHNRTCKIQLDHLDVYMIAFLWTHDALNMLVCVCALLSPVV